nr:hypothetical protein [Streptomyces antimycoticus]
MGEREVLSRHAIALVPGAGQVLQTGQPGLGAVRPDSGERRAVGSSAGRKAGSGWPPARSRTPSGTGGGRREATAGVGATTVPPRPWVTTIPRRRSSL